MMFRQFLPNLSLLIKMKGREYALNMNAGRCGLARLPTCPSPSQAWPINPPLVPLPIHPLPPQLGKSRCNFKVDRD